MSKKTDALEAQIRKLAQRAEGLRAKRKAAKTEAAKAKLYAEEQALRPERLALKAELNQFVRAEQAEAYRLARERGEPEVIVGASSASAAAGGD